jgi:hypothetical protein
MLISLTIFLLAMATEGRKLHNTQAVQYLPGISKSCQQACKNPLVLASAFSKQPASFACRINLDNGEVAPGFQAGKPTCQAAYYNKAVESTNYDCACLAEGQLPGLDAPIGGTCTDTCTKSLDGGSGAALVDGVGHVCIPRTEMGTTNHFGSTDSGKCNFVPGGNQTNSGLSTDNFLCVCGFTAQSATSKDQANG